MRLGVRLDVRAHERAGRDHTQAPPPSLGKGEPYEAAADAPSFELGQDLGVDQREPAVLDDVLDRAGGLAVDPCLVALLLLVVDDVGGVRPIHRAIEARDLPRRAVLDQAGDTLWFRWNTLSGSQARFSWARRASFASPYRSRVCSGPTSAFSFA